MCWIVFSSTGGVFTRLVTPAFVCKVRRAGYVASTASCCRFRGRRACAPYGGRDGRCETWPVDNGTGMSKEPAHGSNLSIQGNMSTPSTYQSNVSISGPKIDICSGRVDWIDMTNRRFEVVGNE